MLDKFFGLFSYDIAIDLGTANTLVAIRGKGIVVREPSIITRHKKTKQVLAVGQEAKLMLGKAPQTLEVVRPLKGGVIADFDATEAMLTKWIRMIHEPQGIIPRLPRPRVIIGIPSGVTEVERRAVQEAALRAGARKAWLIEEAMASALGSGAPVDEPVGVFIVDIGGGTMEIAVISMSGVVVSRSIRVAGDAMDEAIIQYFRLKHALLIGPATAERIKIELASALDVRKVSRDRKSVNNRSAQERGPQTAGRRQETGDKDSKLEVSELEPEVANVAVIRGRDLETGLPKSLRVTAEDVREAVAPIVEQIVTAIQDVVEEVPPELIVDILERGIVLTGGGALLPGLNELVAKQTKMPVRVADDPLTCVVRGCGMLFENTELLHKVRVTGGLR